MTSITSSSPSSSDSSSSSRPASLRQRAARRAFLRVLRELRHGQLSFEEGDERHVFGVDDGLRAHVVVHDPSFWTAALMEGSIGAGRSFMEGAWTTDDLTAVVRVIARNEPMLQRWNRGVARWLGPAQRAALWLGRNTVGGARRNIHRHYDLGNEFFAEFLDPTLMYSSAIYPTPESSLEEAAVHKVHHICRKLDLSPGDEVLEIGTDPLKVDTDTDELGDGEEVITFKTDPLKPDSDDDNLADGEEVNTLGTDPNNPDTDGDRLTDGSEVRTVLTDPNDPDTDDDTVGDGEDACPLVRGVPERNGCPSAPKVGTITDFPAVYFKVDSDAFDFSQEGTTESLAMIMSYVNQCPNLRVLIEGHASREGSDRRNSQLSEMRADRVRLWLVERGIPAEKIAGTIGYGSVRNAVEEPAPDSEEARNMDPEELEAIRRQNRRIAVRVVKTCEE